MKVRMNRALKTVLTSAICALLAVAAWPQQAPAQMANYCSVPSFLSNAVPPNVLIVLDNSGSMNEQAYVTTYLPTQFASGHYYGYFDPTKMYRYAVGGVGGPSNRWAPTTDDPSTATPASPIASGNFLNWATMSRLEAAKKLLIGGKANPRSMTTGCCVKLTGETNTSNFLKPFWNNYVMPANYLIAPYNNVIYPFKGYYGYRRSGGILTIATLSTDTPVMPTSDILTFDWTYSGGTDHYDAINDPTTTSPPYDLDNSYIQNTTSTGPALFNIAPQASYGSGTITSVSIFIVAKRVASTTAERNRTYDFRAFARVGGNTYPSASSSLIKTTGYTQYLLDFNVNPKTNQPWQWEDILGGAPTQSLNAFEGIGVASITTPSSSLYMRVTQMFVRVNYNAPSGSYDVVVDAGTADIHGIIDDLGDEARFGLAYYNNGTGIEAGYTNGRYDGGRIETYIDFATPQSMINSIGGLNANTWTPLAETLYEMIRYFRQEAPYYTGNSPADYQTGQNYDPYYFQYSKLTGSGLKDQYVPCAKSFILFLTDGESTKDQNIPTTLRDYDGDGKDPGSYSSQGTDYMDDVALWGRTEDARPGTCSGTDQSAWTRPCLPGTQNIILYPVFMFGQGSRLLKDAAINGGFNDLNGDSRPGPDIREYLRDSDENGAITSADLPLTYFEGDDGYALQASITQAIADILKRAASGTAVSVLTTSSRGVGSLVQAYFLPVRNEGLREVAWTGYGQNIWLDSSDNLREDTANDFALKLAEDKVLKLYFDMSINETMAATFTTDADGNSNPGTPGSLKSCSPSETKKFSDVVSVFETGKKLALRQPSTRSIFTAKKVIHGPATTHTFLSNDFTALNVTTNATLSAALNPDATYTAENIVRYIRGECLETDVTGDMSCGSTPNTLYRDRRLTVSGGAANGNVWKLGDIVNSTPKVVGNTNINFYHQIYGDITYKDYLKSDTVRKRTSVSLLGANDGMLHAVRLGYLKDKDDEISSLAANVKALFKNLFNDFDGSHDQVGEEAWAYIPFNAFPYLKYLADPDYCHIYYSDLTTRLMDVSIGSATDLPTAIRTQDSWRTVLIGGMNFGGACSGGISPTGPPAGTPANVGFSSFFAIDVTDPLNPVPMWEFSDPDMGYATTYPSVLRTGKKDINGHWYVAVGSGSKQLPKTGADIRRDSSGYVYILDLRTGNIVKKIQLDHNAIVSDIISVDADWWYDVERIFFGTAYKDASSTSWQGKFMKIPVPAAQDLADAVTPWTPTVVTMFTGSYPFTASPDAAKSDSDEKGDVVWVFEGSGKYNTDLDEVDGSQQIFLALKDSSDITYPVTTVNLDDRTDFHTTGTVAGTTQECMFDPATNAFAVQTIVTSTFATSPPPDPSKIGWYLRLDISPTAERVISRPLAIGGLVDFLSYIPNADPCAGGGDSYLYSVDYETGVAPSSVAILSPEVTGGVTSGPVEVRKRVKLGPGSPPKGESIILTPGEGINKKIQTGKGVIVEIENESTYAIATKIIHWLRK